MTPSGDLILAVLAGGEGSRMGRPKGLLHVGGKPILEYLLDRFAWNGPAWLITSPGREHPPGYERFDRELIDPVPGLGPLRGILTALEQADATEVVVTPVDMPRVTGTMLRLLIEQLRQHPEALGIMFRRPHGSGNEIEPVPLALRPGAAACLRNRLDSGRRSVRGLAEGPGFIAVDCSPDWGDDLWLNLNEPADLKALDRLGQ